MGFFSKRLGALGVAGLLCGSSFAQVNYSNLVQGVGLVYSCGLPGPIYGYDDAWKGVVSGDDDTSLPSTFVVARTFVSGRVVAFGHDGIVSALGAYDNKQLMLNVVAWLDVLGLKNVAYTSGHSEWVNAGNLGDLQTELVSRGYAFGSIPAPITSATLSGKSVLIVGNAWSDFSSAEISAVESFAAAGGGVLLFGLGWSWGGDIENYPMTRMAAPYSVRWLREIIKDPTNNVGDSPLFHVFYPDAKGTSLADAKAYLQSAHAAHPANLPSALEANPAFRANYLSAHASVMMPTRELSADHPQRQEVYDFCRTQTTNWPNYFAKTNEFDRATQSAMSRAHERLTRTWVDAVPLTAAVKAEIKARYGSYGRYADLWDRFSIHVMDGHRLNTNQRNVMYNYFDLVSPSLHNLRAISVEDFIGTNPPVLSLVGQAGQVNIFGVDVGGYTENQFPAEVAPKIVDGYSIVLAHEANHVVDAFYVASHPTLKARKEALIAAAGWPATNYLRSMFWDGFFATAPQEFFASIANQWFADSERTFELGHTRFANGCVHPINQAVFFADVYSQGFDHTYFYTLDTAGNWTRTTAPLLRDGNGHVTGVSGPSAACFFTVNTAGDVTAISRRVPTTNTMAVAATFNGWSPTVANMNVAGDHLWRFDTTFTNLSGVEFKFAANKSWAVNWGDNNQGQFGVPMSGTGEGNGANIRVGTTLNGSYRFTFNDQTAQYSLEQVATLDTDADGLPDTWENANGLNPRDATDAFGDADGDGLRNTREQGMGSNPQVADTDGDGANDYVEYVAGTAVTDPASAPALSPSLTGAGLTLTWPGAVGRTYDLLSSDNLTTGAWQPVPGWTNLAGESGAMTASLPSPASTGGQYRLHISYGP